MLRGLDSAFEPSLAQAATAYAEGFRWWAFYCGGAGAYHVWGDWGVATLARAGFGLTLPIYVPPLDLAGGGGAWAADALDRATAMLGHRPGVLALDTEAAERANPSLRASVDAWDTALVGEGITPVVYGGGNYVGLAAPWWIIPGAASAPPGQAYQVGSGTLAGLTVDFDVAGDGFPLEPLRAGSDPSYLEELLA